MPDKSQTLVNAYYPRDNTGVKLSLLHLNIWEGAFIDQVLAYINDHDFDIIQLQEVNGGLAARGGSYFNSAHKKLSSKDALNVENKGIDTFQILKDHLSDYTASQLITWQLKNDPTSYAGNTTLVKKTLSIQNTTIIRHNPIIEITDVWNRAVEDDPRASLALQIKVENKLVWFINTHLAWGPTPEDADYKLAQALKLYDFIKSLKEPFVLSGDFNMTPDTELVKMFSALGHNLTVEHHITNTLNPRTHKVKRLFPPGFAVDFIITSSEIKTTDFAVVETDLSDHFGLTVNLEI